MSIELLFFMLLMLCALAASGLTLTGTDGKEIPAPTSPQDAQFGEWAAVVTRKMEEFGGKFSDLPQELQAKFASEFREEITKLSDKLESQESFSRRRFHQIASHYAGGGAYNGPLGDRGQAAAFGAFVVASLKPQGSSEQKTALEAVAAFVGNDEFAVSQATGPQGGLIMPETLFEGILNRLPDYGMFMEDCPPRPGTQGAKALTWDDGFVLYHPDIEGAPTPSEGTFGAKLIQQARWSVMTLVDRWMLKENLYVALGDFVAEGMARTLAKGAEQRGLHGDGSAAHAKILGIFNWAEDAEYDIVADSGHDTFQEVIDQNTKYLASAIGAMPAEYDDGNAKWYGHRSVYFKYLGLTDANGKPFADIMAMDRKAQFTLMSYPYRFSRFAPKMTDAVQASTTMLVLANLPAALLHTQNPAGAEFLQSEHYKFAEGMTTFLMDSLRGIQQANRAAVARIKTAA